MDLSLFGTAIAIVGGETSSTVFSQLTWIVAITSIPIAYLILPALTRANRTGRKKVASWGMLLFILGSLVAALAPSLSVVIIGRLIQVGIAFAIAGTLAFAASRERAVDTPLFASWATASAIGFIAGPLVAGAVLQFAAWPALFWVEVVLGIVAFVLIRRNLVNGRANVVPPRGDLRGGVLLGIGLLVLAWGFLALASAWEFDGLQQETPSTVAGWALLFVGLAILVVGGVRLRRNLVFRQRFAVGPVTRVSVAALGVGLAAALVTNALYVAGAQQFSPAVTGLLLLPFLLGTAATYLLGRLLFKPWHYRVTILIGSVLWLVALGLSFLITRSVDFNMLAWSVAMILQGVAAGVLMAVTNDSRKLIENAQSLEDGPVISVAGIHAARQLGIAIGVILIGVALTGESVRDADLVIRGWLIAALAGAGAALLWFFRWSSDGELPLSADSSEQVPEIYAEESARGHVRRRPTAALLEFLRQRDLNPLATLPMFSELSDSQRERIVKNSQEVHVAAGAKIFSRGQEADALYVIRSGRVAIEVEGVVIQRLGRGNIFGASELLEGSERLVDAVATRDALLQKISRTSIMEIDEVSFFRAIAVSLSHRLAEVSPRVAEGPLGAPDAVVSLVAIDPQSPIKEIASVLEGLLGRHRTVIAPGRIDRLALERAESLGDVVLLVDDPTDPEWSQFCRRAADRVIAVTTKAEPTPTIPSGAHVVIVDAQPTQEQFTEWFESVRYSSRTLVRTDHLVKDLEPLSDRLAGRSLGLVMGGGGARGLAHIGVMDVLTAAGIRVDRIAGTSMGALVGACFACGLSPDEVDALAFDVMVRQNPMSDYTIPRHSLVRGRRLDQSVAAIFGQTRIEALPIPFACISVDLMTRQQVVHRFGPLGEAVAASSRLPGILPPYTHSLGGIHVDGGLLNNLPVDALNRQEGPIVAVQVSAMEELTEEDAAEPISMGETILRSLMMASNNANAASVELADLVIQPDTSTASLTEFHRLDAMREAGQRAAEAALPDIKRLLQIP